MKCSIAVTVILAVISSNVASESGFTTLKDFYDTDKSISSRIIDGQPAVQGQFPWQVAVRFTNAAGSTFFCGGSLIDRQWVLTAAHCTSGAVSFSLLLGGVTISGTESGRIEITTTDFIAHEDYNPSNLNNDIALIRLPEPILYTSIRYAVTLPSLSTYTDGGQNVTVSGWGRVSDNATGVSNTLNYVSLTTITNEECASVYGSSVIVNSTVCAVGSPHHSTCNGDSGGPLVVYNSNGVAIQVGVVSFVHIAGCGSGNPSGYVRTASYLRWIHEHTGLTISE